MAQRESESKSLHHLETKPNIACNPRFGSNHRRGSMMVLGTAFLVIMMCLAALVIDLGYMRVARAQLRNAADSAALAAGDTLRDSGSESKAQKAAVDFARLNSAAGKPVKLNPRQDINFGRRILNSSTGRWEFSEGQRPYDSVQVHARRTKESISGPVDLFFGGFIGKSNAQSGAIAVSTILPRDIALVLDLSGSTLYDSTLMHESQTTINNRDIWTALGSPRFGKMTTWNGLQYISGGTPTPTIISQLGLTSVPYPYPEGSWSEYVSYVKTDSRLPSSYRNRYGLKTWVDYVLIRRPSKTSTPMLSSTPEQPITALKGALDIMLDYVKSLDTEELVSLSTYDSLSRIERNLTSDLTDIEFRIRELQAGHYDMETNIGDGIRRGRETLLDSSARPQAKKVMIVFTDGLANEPGTESQAKQYALDQAKLTADLDITIHTVSFTALADQGLMAQIARIGKGVHFHVATYDVKQYSRDLEAVLLSLSSIQPVVLTQ